MYALRSLSSAAFGVLPAFALLLGVPTQANATNLIFSGSFSSSGIPAEFDTTPDPFSGTWEFEFDDSQVSGGGGTQRFEVPLTQLTLTPDVIGSTTFDLSNTAATLIYNNSFGGLLAVEIDGFPFGGQSGDNDDFSVGYNPTTGLLDDFVGIGISNANDNTPGIIRPDNVSGSFTVSEVSATQVPEPTSILGLLAVGSLTALTRKRKG